MLYNADYSIKGQLVLDYAAFALTDVHEITALIFSAKVLSK